MLIGVIVNPAAGARSAEPLIPYMREFASLKSARTDVRILTNSDRIETVIKDLQREADVIVVIGGDGSLNGAVNGILNSPRPDTPLAFIPRGKGNDTARSIPAISGTDELQYLFDFNRYRNVDVGRITFHDGTVRRFMNIASMGLSATAADIALHVPRLLGKYCYLIAAGIGLVYERAFDVHIVLSGNQGRTLTGCRMIAVANGRYFGSGLHIAPHARMDDGLFDIVTVSGISNWGVLHNMSRLRNGTHVDLPYVQQWKASSVSISANDRVAVEYDGEIGNELPVEIQIEPGALTWIGSS